MTSQWARSSAWQHARHQGRRTTLPFRPRTQNPAGLSRQWMHSWTVRGSTLAINMTRGPSGGWPPRDLLSLLGRQQVRCHPEVVARRAVHDDVLDGAFRAGEGKAFGDFGRVAAVGAHYDGLHVSHLWLLSK
jgi:hypothetical protein